MIQPKSETALAVVDIAQARVARALFKLGVDRKEWEESPEITPIIWDCMGNQKKAVDMLKFSTDADCKRFMKVYRDLTLDEQERLPLEIPCLAAGVSPWHVLGHIVMSARDVSRMKSALVLYAMNSDVLKATADFGITKVENVKDREMILKATGTLPSPQGSSVNINFGKQAEEVQEETVSDLESDVFAYDAKTIDGWGDGRRKALEGDKQR